MLRRVLSAEGYAIVGRNGSADYSGIIFPYQWPGENYVRECRLRRDKPELEQKPDGSVRERDKYLSPPGRGNMLYFVPGTDPAWLSDTTLPVLITEGEKKTLALSDFGWHDLSESVDRPRWLPVGLSGVWNWRGTAGKTTGPDGERRNVKGPIADLARITWRGRRVTVVFDRNALTNESVSVARRELIKELTRRGANVFLVDLPEADGVNGIDDLIGAWGPESSLGLLKQAKPASLALRDQNAAREFVSVGDDRYRLVVPSIGVTFEIDRLRRERHELIGELCVRCDLPGARTIDGSLITADFNMSSGRARSERAKVLADRANTRGELDWMALLEEFCQRVLQADRAGQPAVELHQLAKPEPNDDFNIEGLYYRNVIRRYGLAMARVPNRTWRCTSPE